jgi:hypothetical protein
MMDMSADRDEREMREWLRQLSGFREIIHRGRSRLRRLQRAKQSGVVHALKGMSEAQVRIEFSFRYGVMGIYKDRDNPTVRVYPLPFVRITLGRK